MYGLSADREALLVPDPEQPPQPPWIVGSGQPILDLQVAPAVSPSDRGGLTFQTPDPSGLL